jgi:hypothetical protein
MAKQILTENIGLAWADRSLTQADRQVATDAQGSSGSGNGVCMGGISPLLASVQRQTSPRLFASQIITSPQRARPVSSRSDDSTRPPPTTTMSAPSLGLAAATPGTSSRSNRLGTTSVFPVGVTTSRSETWSIHRSRAASRAARRSYSSSTNAASSLSSSTAARGRARIGRGATTALPRRRSKPPTSARTSVHDASLRLRLQAKPEW